MILKNINFQLMIQLKGKFMQFYNISPCWYNLQKQIVKLLENREWFDIYGINCKNWCWLKIGILGGDEGGKKSWTLILNWTPEPLKTLWAFCCFGMAREGLVVVVPLLFLKGNKWWNLFILSSLLKISAMVRSFTTKNNIPFYILFMLRFPVSEL